MGARRIIGRKFKVVNVEQKIGHLILFLEGDNFSQHTLKISSVGDVQRDHSVKNYVEVQFDEEVIFKA